MLSTIYGIVNRSSLAVIFLINPIPTRKRGKVNPNGTYRGFSPTDESGIGLGELELVINDDTLSYHFATGLKVHSEEAPRLELRQLEPHEVAERFNPEANIAGITGYVLNEDGAILLLLAETPEAPETPRALLLRFVSDEIDAIFGPTVLFTPEQVEAGYFDQTIAEIEAQQGDIGVIPRLANNGKRG
jgi:hypothetical protein